MFIVTVDGEWSFWESWTHCSVTCANGTRSRSRDCSDPVPAHGGANCTADNREIEICDTDLNCPGN